MRPHVLLVAPVLLTACGHELSAKETEDALKRQLGGDVERVHCVRDHSGKWDYDCALGYHVHFGLSTVTVPVRVDKHRVVTVGPP